MFLRGQLETHDNLVTIALDSEHSLRITNPEAVRGEEGRRVVLHGVSTDGGFRVISFATIDDRDIPEDTSFAAVVAQRTDAEMVEHLLQLGANPNAKTKEGVPAIVQAMHMTESSLIGNGIYPNVEITTLLLDRGADPNALNKNWQTPLMAAASFGDEKLVKLFIDHHANVNIGSRFGETALMCARALPVVRMLISAGASVNDENMTGETALYYATQRADPDAVKALLEVGANVTTRNNRGMAPLDRAQLELGPDDFWDGVVRDARRERVQRVIELLLGAGALLARPRCCY
ncbi:MAG TPA: ankyrin repeat domain-containing protein [Candidatus Sulfotelmatobacter sp.]|nr:ankyrin repeat domain-containing protein [Candidatus Sulfotelmatobacter sp.]